MSQKIATTTECLLNRKVELISGKWYNDKETISQEHQAMQGKIGNNPEDEKCALDTLKAQDIDKKCDCENILDIANKKSPKRLRRQPVIRNNDFLWTNISKN